METAVLIQTHNNAKYICALALHNPKIRFYIHVDKKKPEVFNEINAMSIPNIKLIQERINVYWGGSSQLFATLKLMMEAIKHDDNKFFHLMSGECLPLKSFSKIESEWKLTPNINYIESCKAPDYEWRLKTLYPHTNTRYLRTPFGRLLTKILKSSTNIIPLSKIDKEFYYFGSQWFSITRSAITRILSVYQNTSFFSNFKYTTCADEHAFQILVRKYNIDGISNNNKRLIIFNHGSSPIFLSKQILIDASKTNNYWFARKVKGDLGAELLTLISN